MNKIQAHRELAQRLQDTYVKKNKDYGDSFSKQFEEYGEISAAIRLEDKLNRFKSLMNSKAQVKDESKEDTLLDLANYAIMTVMDLRKQRYELNAGSHKAKEDDQ
ncbi:nucleotide modification associated domain-containing protein [Halobacillus karajensis]|uniref:nucleotide modification associated domain-containing protein n=1 Tax=Halobacillus karajensis TaxID=195088 RepID=UPI00045D4E93|nr:nucleotide modification associated domain-containing protein [Halobacillus karajensis]CDQ17963.1 hypothetical protein BN982_00203 [Halobacillus karajensis]